MPRLSVLPLFPRLAAGLQSHGNAAFVVLSVCVVAFSGQPHNSTPVLCSEIFWTMLSGCVAMGTALLSSVLPPRDIWAYKGDKCTLKIELLPKSHRLKYTFTCSQTTCKL